MNFRACIVHPLPVRPKCRNAALGEGHDSLMKRGDAPQVYIEPLDTWYPNGIPITDSPTLVVLQEATGRLAALRIAGPKAWTSGEGIRPSYYKIRQVKAWFWNQDTAFKRPVGAQTG